MTIERETDIRAVQVGLEHTLRLLMRMRRGELFTANPFSYGKPLRACYRCNGSGGCRDCG